MPRIPDAPQVPEVTVDLLHEAGPDPFLLDVREPREWAVGHAPDARHLPMGDVVASLDSLPADRTIVAVCRSGGRSARVTELLCASGFDARNLVGGMQAWEAAGRPVVTDDGGPGSVA